MKIRVQKAILDKAVQKLRKVAPARSKIPILSNVLISTRESDLLLAATDLESFITISIAAEIKETGSITVRAKQLAELLKGIPDLPVTITAEGIKISLEVNGGHYTLMGFPAGDFPAVPVRAKGAILEIDGKELVEMVHKTSYAVYTKDKTRPALMGVLFKAAGSRLTLGATDGRRLPIVSRNISPVSKGFQAIVSPKALCSLTRLIVGKEMLKQVIVGQDRIEFDFGELHLSSRLIEGEYPVYENMIPKENQRKMIADRGQLIAAIERVSVMTDPEQIPVCFSVSRGMLDLSTKNNGVGEAREQLPVEYEQDDFTVGFSSTFILDLLKHMPSDKVLFELDSPASCVVIRPTIQPKEEDYLCLIMPMRLE